VLRLEVGVVEHALGEAALLHQRTQSGHKQEGQAQHPHRAPQLRPERGLRLHHEQRVARRAKRARGGGGAAAAGAGQPAKQAAAGAAQQRGAGGVQRGAGGEAGGGHGVVRLRRLLRPHRGLVAAPQRGHERRVVQLVGARQGGHVLGEQALRVGQPPALPQLDHRVVAAGLVEVAQVAGLGRGVGGELRRLRVAEPPPPGAPRLRRFGAARGARLRAQVQRLLDQCHQLLHIGGSQT
jgi:hypothetical protein